MRNRLGVVLARHFFTSLFDFGILTDKGADSFKHALLGALAVAMGLGLLLVRVFMAKYAALGAASAQTYEQAVAADHAFLVALPMWIVGAACAIAGESLFPGEVDYRILMAQPLSARTIFSAKLAALLLFGGLFVVGAHVALAPLIALTLLVGANTHSVIASASAFAIASATASLFAALAIVAIQGLLVIFVPRARLLTFSAGARSIVICVLVLSLPLVVRLPATAPAFSSDAWWLRWAPPAWFVGLERWLMGDTARAPLAAEAMIATIVALTLSVWSYVLLYRRFDRVTLHGGESHALESADRVASRLPRASVKLAVWRFVSITLRRSVVHQSIVVGLLAGAAGLVVNGLLASGVSRVGLNARANVAPIGVLVWAPMALVFLASPAIRLALSVPLELRANWIFRMTEDATTRGDAIAAAVRTVMLLGVALPIALVAPLQWWWLGSRVVVLVFVEWLIGWLLVELLMKEWRRIPFTCSYMPGKGFVPHVAVKVVAFYMIFTSIAVGLLRVCLANPPALPIIVLLVGLPAGLLYRRRTYQARVLNLTFEDEPATDVTLLRLNAD